MWRTRLLPGAVDALEKELEAPAERRRPAVPAHHVEDRRLRKRRQDRASSGHSRRVYRRAVKEPSRIGGAASGNRQDGPWRVTTALHHSHDTLGEHRQAPVRDVIFVAVVIAFFAVAALFVRICEAIVGPTTEQVDE